MKSVQIAACILGMIAGFCFPTVPVYAAEEEAHVLILNGLDPYLPAYLVIDSGMRAGLANETQRRVVLFSEPLDAQRFSVEAFETEYLALLTKKYSRLRIDVVVTVSQVALEFFKRNGERLWPGARVVYEGFPGEVIGPAALPPNATGVVSYFDVARTIDIAQRLQPDARRILVVAGASDLDKRLEQLARQVLSTRAELPSLEFLSGLPLPELVARVAAEPTSTIVFYLTQFRDRDGRPYVPREVLRAISNTSVAPVYGGAETYVGFGLAAGSMESYVDKGRLVGEQVHAALVGGPSDPSRILLESPSRCVADARALRRWSLDERRLPSGCEIRFADLPVWRQYWRQIVVTLVIIAGQTILIVALFSQRRRRRSAEAESQKRFSELAHMNRQVAMGELSASIAHELNQPLGAIQNNASAAELLIKADPPKLREVAEILGDIKRDDQRASDIIARFRKLLRRTESEVRDTDLNEAIDETVKMLAAEAAAKEVIVKAELEPTLPKVRADRVQLQQVILNLVLNAMEAMQSKPAEKRMLTVRSRRANDKEVEVIVADSGDGIPKESIGAIFDPFVTTKAGGMGLGLAISRTIVEAHRGKIWVENAPEGGALIHFTVPLASASQV